MNDELDLNREPIELVEFVLPKCANVYGVAPCTASGGTGDECYNCRATCQDPDNYRDTPDRHLDADLALGAGDVIDSADITRTADLFAGFEVRFGSTPEGVIWQQGANVADAAHLGVIGTDLVFRAGDSSVASGAGVGRIAVDVSAFTGKTVFLYVEIDFTASSTSTIRFWSFDPVELTLTLLGTDTFTASTEWADGFDGFIGEATFQITGETIADWNGGITIARFYDSTAAPTDMSDNFKSSLWLGRGEIGEPTEEQYILPCLDDLSTVGSRINLAGADDNYEPLGRRATLDFSASDFAHSDVTQDPYLSTRSGKAEDKSTFWRKWLRRQKFGKVGALVKVYDGYAGNPISQYNQRAYVLDRATYNEDSISFHCRDVLSRTEFSKAQIPEQSTGILFLGMTDVQTTFRITGDVLIDYPATGTVRMNDEVMTYTGRTYNGADDSTDFTGVTRATDGSEAAPHETGDLVQLCYRVENSDVKTELIEWLTVRAKIEGQLINIAGIESESDAYLQAYILNSLITEPTGVSELIGRLSQETGFYIWWQERDQKIDFKAIRAVGVGEITDTITYEDNIVGGSFKVRELPKQRLNVINFYYNPIDYTRDLDKANNFKNGLRVINGTTSLPEQYGNLIQTRNIYSIFLGTEATANQTSSRLSIRYADIPLYSDFYLDAKDRELWTGDIVRISHPMVVDADGNRDLRRWLCIEAEEIDPGHLVRYMFADITLDGLVYVIAENVITTYTAELFAEGNAFITDNNGLNPDGTQGARIA